MDVFVYARMRSLLKACKQATANTICVRILFRILWTPRKWFECAIAPTTIHLIHGKRLTEITCRLGCVRLDGHTLIIASVGRFFSSMRLHHPAKGAYFEVILGVQAEPNRVAHKRHVSCSRVPKSSTSNRRVLVVAVVVAAVLIIYTGAYCAKLE